MSTQRQAIIVFARMSSSRLPGKVLMDFAGRSLLAHIIARAQLLGLPVSYTHLDVYKRQNFANCESCSLP